MTGRPPKPCLHPGCKKITLEKNGYCLDHQDEYEKREAIRNRRRGGNASARSRGYTRTWEKVRIAQLYREPLCRIHKRDGFVKIADRVHHIDGNPTNNNESNLMSICRQCHEKIHGRVSNAK